MGLIGMNHAPIWATRDVQSTLDRLGKGFIGNWDPLDDVGLVTIDLENLLIPYKGEQPFDSPRILGLAERIGERGMRACLITNADDEDRLRPIAEKLEMQLVHKGQTTPDGRVLKSKSHPDMYAYAAQLVGFGKHGTTAAHFDDQLKNYQGMRKAPEFSRFFWTFPKDMLRSHPGVLAARIVEVPAAALLHLLHQDDNV